MLVLVNPRRFVQRVGILAVAGIAVFGFVAGQSAGASSSQATEVHYSVHQGDTLWSIAKAEAPEADPRDYIATLVQLNQLTTAAVTPGQDLLLPKN